MKKATSNRTIPPELKLEVYARLVNGVMSFLYGQGNQKADGSVGLWNSKIKDLPTRVYFLKTAIRDYERSDDYKMIKEKWGHKVIFKSYKRWLKIINKYYPKVILGAWPTNRKFDVRTLNKNIKASREEFYKQLKANKFEKKGSLKITYSKPFKINL